MRITHSPNQQDQMQKIPEHMQQMFYAMCDESIMDTPIMLPQSKSSATRRKVGKKVVPMAPATAAIAKEYTHLLLLKHHVAGMHADILKVNNVTENMISQEFKLFLSSFMKDPLGALRSIFIRTTCDSEIVEMAQHTIGALASVHVLCPLKKRNTLPILYGLLMSKRCKGCPTLDLTCGACAWSDCGSTGPMDIAQRFVSVLPHAPWNGHMVKQKISALLHLQCSA